MQPSPVRNRDARCPAPDEGLHESLARAALADPAAIALTWGRQSITYGELDRVTDAWAAQLTPHVGLGDRVPVVLPRGLSLVLAAVAVLKTGAAYSLLDPAWPAQRTRSAIEQLSARLVISDADLSSATTVPVWEPPAEPVKAPPWFRPVPVRGDDPCCVFFTSGTTGTPKGVLTTHRATARLFQPGGFAEFTADTVVPLAAPMSWDAFSLELWSALLNGGRSWIVAEPFLTGPSLRDGIAHGVTTVWLTSSLFNVIVDEDPTAFTGLRQIMIGGERLSQAHVARFLRRHPEVALLNGYGPVESTVFATTHRIRPADAARPEGVPLGRPVPGTDVHVLDGDRVCAVDEVGEICISGSGLALGYLADSDLTDTKFRSIRIGEEDVRVYRTGDLGSWSADGLLRFHGRTDRQLKIRGHRVEPAEVERQVEALVPGVRACRVVATRDRDGAAESLVAFCIPARPGDPLGDALPLLQRAMVSYQRPSRVVSVDSFPLTAQGKLDERAMLADVRAPEPGPSDSAAGVERGGDPIARAASGVFAAVLGRDAVPLDVPLVELGGTSLDAGRVCARLSARLGRPVPVSWIFEHPTVAGLARRIGADAATPQQEATSDVDGRAALTPMQLVFLAGLLLDPDARTGHCLLVWEIEGPLDRAALRAAVAAVHHLHEPLRAAYKPDPRPIARLVDREPPTLEILPDHRRVSAAVDAIRAELGNGLDPVAGVVWRTALVPVEGGTTAVFGCVVHHIAFDGGSESVLADDLSAAYADARLGVRPADPSPRPLAVAHAEHVRRSATDLAPHRDHLLAELADAPELRWPAVPDPRRTGGIDEVVVMVPSSDVAVLDASAAGAGVTRFVLLLTEYARSLAAVTGQDDFVVGVPLSQRGSADAERAIGCFINMVGIRLRANVLAGGIDGVKAAGRVVRRALAAQDVPFSAVVQLVGPRPTGRAPLFQTLFALQDNETPPLHLGDGMRTVFRRQPYADLPLELHTEVWPDGDGSLRIVVSYRPEVVAEDTAQRLAATYVERLLTTSRLSA